MIVRTGLAALPGVLEELGVARPLLVTTARWAGLELPVAGRFAGVQPHADARGVAAAREAAEAVAADGLLALGGGSAIDTAKAVSAATGLPVVSVPTTYSGAEWTAFFGTRDAATGIKHGGAGARTEAVVYAVELTIGLPPGETGGTALNALAHCAEALYAPGRTPETDEDALTGARLIAEWLPRVLADGADREARSRLLEGAMHAGRSLRAGMGVAHAMAQALGGRYAVSHGLMNAICLPPGLRFNLDVAAEAVARLTAAMGTDDAPRRCEELAALAGPNRLRDHGIPREGLPAVAEAAADRAAAKANPKPVSPPDVLALLESVW